MFSLAGFLNLTLICIAVHFLRLLLGAEWMDVEVAKLALVKQSVGCFVADVAPTSVAD